MLNISGLTDLERDVLLEILAAHPDPDSVLQDQFEHARIVSREMSGVGFFLKLATDSTRAFPADGEFTGTCADIPGLEHPVMFALFIREGRIDWLEGWTVVEPWPEVTSGYRLYRIASATKLH